MKKDNFIKKIFLDIKYFKNDCIIKYKVAKRDGFKNKKIKTNNNSKHVVDVNNVETRSKNDSPFAKINIEKENKSTESIVYNLKNLNIKGIIFGNIGTLTIGILIIVGSFFVSNNLFNIEKQYNFYNITHESENKILNTLKSPKTNVSVELYPIDNRGVVGVKRYFNVVDNLDSYTYKISFESAGSYLSSELWKSYMSRLKPVNKLKGIEIKNVSKYKNYYIINNRYKIDSSKVDSNKLDQISKEDLQMQIKAFNNYRNIEIALITIFVAIIGNLIFFYIKKVISKK